LGLKQKRQPRGLPSDSLRERVSYCFGSAGGGVVVLDGGGVGPGSSRIPALNSLMPWPRPRIKSGILRPPNNMTTIIKIRIRCIGLNSIKPPYRTDCSGEPPRNTAPGQANCTYSITRSSPLRRVKRTRSMYSSNGMACLRLMPVSSLKAAIGKRSPCVRL
jgi:hypothetical protein